jgi:hypothetical protein
MWTLSRDDVATKTRLDIQSKEFMLTIIWTTTGFYIVDRLPNDNKMNSAYLMTYILPPLEQTIFSRGRAPHQKPLVSHLGNYSVYVRRGSRDWLDEYDMRRRPQRLDSPDLASSDFYLFPTVKEKLERTQVADEDEIFELLRAILRRIDREELNRVFQSEVWGVQEASENNGDDVG